MINQITPQIWIGDQVDAYSEEILKHYKINCIINLNDKDNPDEDKLAEKLGINYIVYRVPEHKQFTKRLKEAAEILEHLHSTENNRILVHCQAGMDRAPFVVALYLSKIKKIPLSKAYNIVRYFRPQTIEHYEWV